MGLNPKQSEALIDSSMIQFNKDKAEDTFGKAATVAGWQGWAKRAKAYLDGLKEEGKDCAPGKGNGATSAEACKFKKTELGTCADVTKNAGFDDGVPCLFLKLNKIYGVENIHYNSSTDSEIPDDFPEGLADHIDAQEGKHSHTCHNSLTCHSCHIVLLVRCHNSYICHISHTHNSQACQTCYDSHTCHNSLNCHKVTFARLVTLTIVKLVTIVLLVTVVTLVT